MARTKQTARKTWNIPPPSDDDESTSTVQSLWPTPEKPAPMTPEQQRQIEQEDFYRQLFATNRNSSELSDPHVLLMDVFENSSKFVYQQETEEEKAVPKILTKERDLSRTGPCIVSKTEFLKHWQEFTNGILDGLNWNNVFAAGGSVLANITNPHNPEHFASSDIDLFLYGFETDDEANRKLEHIFSVVSKNTKQEQIVRSHRAITILGVFPNYRHVQIILRLFKSPAEVLLGFDVDCCTVGFDGTTVWGSERFLRSLSKGYNLVNTTRRSLTYETRLRKYSKRGFAVAVPNLDKAQVDPSLFTKSATDVQGLAKLIIYEYYEINPPSFYPMKSYSTHKIIPRRFLQYERRSHHMNTDNIDLVHDITGEEDSDYAEFIPWGPAWYSSTILRMLDYKDKAQTFSGLQAQRNKVNRQQGGSKPPVEHRHNYVTGIKGVIEGSSSKFWCRYCREKMPLARDENGKDVCGPLAWDKNNAVYQDLDLGFKRSFAGSFQPILEENWTKDVYSPSYRPRDEPHPLFPTQPQSPQKKKTSFFSTESTTVLGEGGQHFESQNQMMRAQREQLQQPTTQTSPFGNSVEAFGGAPSVDIFSNSVQAFGGGTLPFVSTSAGDTPNKTPVARNLNSPPFKSLLTRTPAAEPRREQQYSAAPDYSQSSLFASARPTKQQPLASGNNNNNNNDYNATIASQPAPPVKPPKWWHLFGGGRAGGDSQMNIVSQGLLLVGGLYRKGAITVNTKSELKDLILANDPVIISVLEAFLIDEDVAEVVDSFTRALAAKGIPTQMYRIPANFL